MEWYLKVLKQYADFKGRARRKEYWMFTLLNFIFVNVALLLGLMLGGMNENLIGVFGFIYLVVILYTLAILIPSIAVLVRRLHDIGKSGGYYFVSLIPVAGPIWLLVMLCTDGEAGPNMYGPNPKETETVIQ
jgi:uncharacterized membrane protein YhaH (DUF805 family)